MPNLTLASAPITTTDHLVIELVRAIETPAAPTVCNPRRFPAAALAVVAVMDEAMTALKAADL